MSKKLLALALCLLLMLGAVGCASSTNVTEDGWRYHSGDNYPDDPNGVPDDAQRQRFHEMLENGRVHDSDGYLLDGENRRD